MKKPLLSLVSLILVLSMLLCGLIACDKDTPPSPDQPNDDTPPSAPAAEPYVSSEKYFTDEQLATIRTALEAGDSAFTLLDKTVVPAVSMNLERLSGCSITSISIPAQKTLTPDALGNFTFTVSGFYDLFTLCARASAASWAKEYPKSMPTLIAAGDRDPVGKMGKAPRATAARLKNAGASDVTLKLYEGARHELCRETCRKAFFEDLIAWLNKRF